MSDDFTERRGGDPGRDREPPPRALRVYERDLVHSVPVVPPMVVGRAEDADLVLADRSLSRRHARFVDRSGEVWIEDLGSTNGVLVNGREVEAAVVRAGDRIAVGDVLLVPSASAEPPDGGPRWSSWEAMEGAVEEALRGADHGSVGLLLLRARGLSRHLAFWAEAVEERLGAGDVLASFGRESLVALLRREQWDDARSIAREVLDRPPARAVGLRASLVVAPRCGVTWAELIDTAAAQLEARQGPKLREPRPEALGPDEDDLIATSEAMVSVVELADRIAASAGSVMLVGETGTGKELLARRIHRRSDRTGRWIAVSCSALVADQLQATLFGYVRGAFTGAVGERPGVFEQADGGTLLLDEVADLPPVAQAALLRVLASGKVHRMGSTEERAVEVRVIGTTQQDLRARVDAGSFREDLYFRLHTFVVHLPPLRERTEDLPALVDAFLDRFASAHANPRLEIGEDAVAHLLAQPWPGNVRQLKNTLERATCLAQNGVITAEDVAPDPDARARMPRPFKERVAAFEQEMIRQALRESGGNKTAAAKRLGMPLRTFMSKVPPDR